MSFRNSVTIVASPRPRVGKTLLARLLTDFHRHEGRSVQAFDLNSGEGTLTRFLPGQANVASIADIQGQMALFDQLITADGVNKVIDLGHESFAAFFAITGQIDFAAEARRRAVAPAAMFIMTPDRTSVDAYHQLHERQPAMTLLPVHNEILGPAQHRQKYQFLGSGPLAVRMPVLAPALRKAVEIPPLSLVDVHLGNRRGVPAEAEADLQRWLRRIFVEFRELELRTLLADLQNSFKFGAQ